MSEISITESQLGDLQGKVSIVTGGASGIGKAIVEILAQRGGHVAFCDLNSLAGKEVEDSLKAQGFDATFFRVNVASWNDLVSFFARVRNVHGRIDLVFANAGIGDKNTAFKDVLEADGSLAPPDLSVIDVNVKGVIFTSKLALHHMRQNSPPGGGLVITGSTSSYNERPNLPLYSMAKHGVIGLMRALRHNAPKDNINVGAIAPGGTETGLFTPEAADAFRAQGIPVNKAASVALAAIYLANNPDTNGKALTIIGDRYTEVEDAILKTQHLWYGQYNTDMAQRAASVRLDTLARNEPPES